MGELLRRLLYLLRWRRHDDDLTAELDFHRRMKEAELAERGLDPRDAAARARKALGNDLGSRDRARDVWIPPRLQDVVLDTRVAARLLVRDRGFAATAILVLGLGIGVNNMMFTLIHAHTMRGLPIARPDRIVSVSIVDERGADRGLSAPEVDDLRDAATSVAGIGAYTAAPVALGDEGRAPDRFEAAYVSANAFSLMEIRPAFGRGFATEDDRPGAPAVVLLGATAWQSRYADDPGLLGRAVLVNGSPATVIGILQDRSGFPSTAQVWLPLAAMPGLAAQKRDARTLRVFARLGDTIASADARSEIEAIVAGWATGLPDTSRGIRARVMPINQRLLGRPTDPAWMAFMTAGFLILLVSCANAANLLLARSVERRREIAIRVSLGASRLRVVHQLLIESSVLALAAGALGAGISVAGVRVFSTAIPANVLPYWIDYSMDGRVLAALVLVSLGAIAVFGLVPALQASRVDVNAILKVDGRTAAGRPRAAGRWMVGFMTAQIALGVVLLAHVVADLATQEPDLPSEAAITNPALITGAVTLSGERYRTPDQRAAFYSQMQERLGGIPGVTALSLVSALPVRGALEQRLDLDGRERASGETAPTVLSVAVAPRYFETLGLTIARGRDLTPQDGANGPGQALVNQRFVELHVPDGEAIGRQIRLTTANLPASGAPWLTIIGVVPNVRQRPGRNRDAIVYTALRAAPPPSVALVVRAEGDRGSIATLLREGLLALDSNLPLYRTETVAQSIRDAEWNGRVSVRLVTLLTIIAFTLSIVGLYAVTAHAVGQRMPEFVVRVALGAGPGEIRRLVLKRASLQVALGLIVGILCTMAWGATFVGSLNLSVTSPWVLVPVGALLAVVTGIACIVPVHRATSLDPAVALRRE